LKRLEGGLDPLSGEEKTKITVESNHKDRGEGRKRRGKKTRHQGELRGGGGVGGARRGEQQGVI